MVFKKMKVGDVATVSSESEMQLLRAIEGSNLGGWIPGADSIHVKKLGGGKYEYEWTEKYKSPRWWVTYTLPKVSPIPEGYEPAFEGEEIQKGWKFFSQEKWQDCVSIGDKVASFFSPIIKPKKPVSSGPAIPDGYESIQEGDVIQAGDMHFFKERWNPVIHSVGIPYRPGQWESEVVRKKPVANTAEHGPIPEGYKLYEEGEILEPGDMYWNELNCKWMLLDYKLGEKKPSHWTSVIIKPIKKPTESPHGPIPEGYELIGFGETYRNGDIVWNKEYRSWREPRSVYEFQHSQFVARKKPTISTMEHQDGATTTTVSLGGIGSKFEKNGREYEVTHETEVAHSNGLRQIEIKAVSRPVYGESPIKKAVDELHSLVSQGALDAVAEAAKILDNRPSWIYSSPWLSSEVEKAARKTAADAANELSKSLKEQPSVWIDERLAEKHSRKVSPEFLRQYEAHKANRKQWDPRDH